MKRAIFFILLACFSGGFAFAKDYTIGVGDILSIRVWGEDSLGGDVRVRPDGKISLAGVGDIKAEGVTPMALQRSIAAKLSSIVHEPMVTVMVHTASNNAVVVHGPGVRSAVLLLERETTVLQLLAQVAPEYGADLENACVRRDGQVAAKNFQALFTQGGGENNIVLQPGDIIYIPLKEKRYVFVVGAVEKPSTLPHYDGMTLLEAIHLAGGFTKFADRNDTRIVREGPGGKETIRVRAGDLTEKGDLAQNVRLSGGDVVQVEKGWF